MTRPVRVQLSRKKGWRLQEASRAANGLEAVKVDRTTKWGNPFKVGEDGTTAECVDLYRALLAGYLCLTSKASIELQTKSHAVVAAYIADLRGKNLACWCRKDRECHADVLLEIANRDEPE